MTPTWGVARITPSAAGTYSPAGPDGTPAVILAVTDRDGRWVDTFAWSYANPSRWWFLLGDETPLLGAEILAIAAYYGDPIILHATPQDWLLGGCHGVCVVKWGWPLDGLFDGVSDFQCDSTPLQRKLISALRRWEPSVVVRRGSNRAA